MPPTSRDAWLAAFTAVLGLSHVECRGRTSTGSVAVQEVAPVVVDAAVASDSPDAAVTAEPSAMASSPAPSASTSAAPKKATNPLAGLGDTEGTGTGVVAPGSSGGLRIGIGRDIVNPSCGATSVRPSDVASADVQLSPVTSPVPDDTGVVVRLRPGLRACATKALQQDPNEQGRLGVQVEIAANGEVTTASVVNNTGLSQATVACMLARVRRAQFPPGTARTIRFDLNQIRQN